MKSDYFGSANQASNFSHLKECSKNFHSLGERGQNQSDARHTQRDIESLAADLLVSGRQPRFSRQRTA
jgi:hypothetical protein